MIRIIKGSEVLQIIFWGLSQKYNIIGKLKGFRSIDCFFSKKHMQGGWKGSKPVPNRYYVLSENRLMGMCFARIGKQNKPIFST